MVQQIVIERFKSIESATLDLDRINVLVGANNSGKSSVLQALQFTTSVAQTAKLYSQTTKFDKKGVWATSVYPDQLIYSPVKDPYVLAKGGVLKEDENLGISVTFAEDNNQKVIATFRKGRNKNIAARFEGETVGQHLASLENPFCMYVPGLAGIPFEEEIRTVGVVRSRFCNIPRVTETTIIVYFPQSNGSLSRSGTRKSKTVSGWKIPFEGSFLFAIMKARPLHIRSKWKSLLRYMGKRTHVRAPKLTNNSCRVTWA